MRSLPAGFVRDKNGTAYKKLEAAFLNTAAFYGYDNVDATALYPIAESFFCGDDNRFKLIDREGEILCVIDDAVTGLLNATEAAPERLATSTEVYKYVGDKRNERQFAALLTGFGGVEGEFEMITLGKEVLANYGITDAKVFISNVMVLQGIAETYLGHRPDSTELKKVIDRTPKTDSECALDTLIKETMAAKGDISVLKDIAERTTTVTGSQGLKALLDLSDLAEACGINDVTFDLSILGRDYDGGNVFEIRDEEGTVLAIGGRHDFIDGNGVMRASSLIVYPEKILASYRLKETEHVNAIIGVADSMKAVASAYKLKDDLIKNDIAVSLLYKTGKSETFAYAEAFGINTAVYVDADGGLTNN